MAKISYKEAHERLRTIGRDFQNYKIDIESAPIEDEKKEKMREQMELDCEAIRAAMSLLKRESDIVE